MLTSGQCRVAAYMTDGGIVCVECGEKKLSINRENELEARELAFEEQHGHPARWSEQRDIEDGVDRDVAAEMEKIGIQPLIQYNLDSNEAFATEGCYCDDCGTELVEPTPDVDSEEEVW
jgi:hypothetical protein